MCEPTQFKHCFYGQDIKSRAYGMPMTNARCLLFGADLVALRTPRGLIQDVYVVGIGKTGGCWPAFTADRS